MNTIINMVPNNVRTYLKTIGKKGGKARSKKLGPQALSSQAHRAVSMRWVRRRFKVGSFKEMGIPGWEIVDAGLHDLAHGNFLSINALAVIELRPKLRFLGVPVPNVSPQISNSRTLLYEKMEDEHGEMAHARFCALLERLDSFCSALESITSIPPLSPHRHRRWCA